MAQPVDITARITRRNAHPVFTRPSLSDRALYLTCDFLRANGLSVLDGDWRSQSQRFGVVAQDGQSVAFVAVFVRPARGFVQPDRLVTGPMRLKLRSAAGDWLRERAAEGPVGSLRFDLVTAALTTGGTSDLRLMKGVA
jgi:putative endonuclease